MRVLVCGGRNYHNYTFVKSVLDDLPKEGLVIIQGGARGADSLALDWSKENNVSYETFPADWVAYGKSAGFIRNKEMLTHGKPDLVIAFPGGKGTENMIAQAKKADIDVEVFWEGN